MEARAWGNVVSGNSDLGRDMVVNRSSSAANEPDVPYSWKLTSG